jgi:hypothetical protein
MSDQQRIGRGAAEEASGTPVTETEVDASRRPPSEPNTGGGMHAPIGGPTSDATTTGTGAAAVSRPEDETELRAE